MTFLLYAGVVVWLTWPLARHLTTHLPGGRPDALYMAWVLAYESHALTTAPLALLDTNIFHPARRTLFYGDTGFGMLPYFLPTFVLTGNPTLAINVAFLGCIALTASALHLVVHRWTGSHLAGLVAGWTLLTRPWVLWEFIPSAPSYAVLQYFPAIVLLAATPERLLPLLPLVVLQCLTDVVYVAPAVLVPLGVLALGRTLRSRTRAAGLRLLTVLALALVVLAPVYLGHRAVWAANPLLQFQSYWTSFLAPMWPTLLPSALSHGPIAVGYAPLLLIVAGALSAARRRLRGETEWRRRAWLHGGFWAAVGTFISMTPVVSWSGRSLRLPQYYLMQWLPIVRTVRIPERLGVAGLFGLAILVGVAFAECTRRVPDRGHIRPLASAGMALLAMIVIYAGYGTAGGTPGRGPYPLAQAITGHSQLIQLLRMRDGPLLELPVGTPGAEPASAAAVADPGFHARAMYRSIFHWRPLLNGYSSYWPAGFGERMFLASRLPDPEALATLRHETRLETIVVHFDDLGASERAAWHAIAEDGRDDLALVGKDGDDLVFAVR